jgi:ribosomal-protein-alanine N-acetyltransferase
MQITTHRLMLREFRRDDWYSLNLLESDPLAVKYQSYAPHTEDDSRAYLEKNMIAMAEHPRRLFEFAVLLRGVDLLVGRCGFEIQAEGTEAAIWYILRRDYWGQGLMREALTQLISFAFDLTGVHRIWADTDPRNVRSVNLLRHLGFSKESHFQRNVLIKGEWCDTLIFFILKENWIETVGSSGRA